jgi:hypothetical protein
MVSERCAEAAQSSWWRRARLQASDLFESPPRTSRPSRSPMAVMGHQRRRRRAASGRPSAGPATCFSFASGTCRLQARRIANQSDELRRAAGRTGRAARDRDSISRPARQLISHAAVIDDGGGGSAGLHLSGFVSARGARQGAKIYTRLRRRPGRRSRQRRRGSPIGRRWRFTGSRALLLGARRLGGHSHRAACQYLHKTHLVVQACQLRALSLGLPRP